MYYAITTNNLNVRKGPSTLDPVIVTILKNKVVSVLNEKDGWGEVRFEGVSGYCNLSYLNRTPVARYSKKRIELISTKSITWIDQGEKVNLYDITGDWGRVKFMEKEGYVKVKDLISKEPIILKESETNKIPIFIRPCVGVVTSEFGTRSMRSEGSHHNGIDIANNGNIEIKSVAAGKVVKSYTSTSYGECVIIQHKINDKVFESLYAHMKAGKRKVKVGEGVKQGQVIGMMGSTGDSTSQHLHFELHEGKWDMNKSNAVNPRKYVDF